MYPYTGISFVNTLRKLVADVPRGSFVSGLPNAFSNIELRRDGGRPHSTSTPRRFRSQPILINDGKRPTPLLRVGGPAAADARITAVVRR